jgi:hypothetical protein
MGMLCCQLSTFHHCSINYGLTGNITHFQGWDQLESKHARWDVGCRQIQRERKMAVGQRMMHGVGSGSDTIATVL